MILFRGHKKVTYQDIRISFVQLSRGVLNGVERQRESSRIVVERLESERR